MEELCSLERFSYEQVPLTEGTRSTHIRLVYLSPAEPDDPSKISLEMKSMPVNHPPMKYAALSYAWGKVQFTIPVTLNSRKFHITPSLAEALLQLSQERRSTPIWIDQICIDQSSIDERNAQVCLMAKIYSQAVQVLIWLGPAADGSNELMDGLVLAGEKAAASDIEELLTEENWPKFIKWTTGQELDDDSHRRPFEDLCSEILPSLELQPLKAWFLRHWFHRVWIVQEFCLAKDAVFMCGGKSASADYIKFAWRVLQLRVESKVPKPEGPLPQGPENFQQRLDFTKRQKAWLDHLRLVHELHGLNPITPLMSARRKKQSHDYGKGRGSTLFELLKTFSTGRRQSTDARDWIYGLTALPNDVDKLHIVPDYDLSCEVVFAKYTRSVIKNGDLEILRYSQFPKTKDVNLPSWVPDWQQHPQTTFDYADDKNSSFTGKLLFSASRDSKVSVTDLGDERLLALQGLIVDEIEMLGQPWSGGLERKDEGAEVLAYLCNINSMCMISATRNQPIYPTEQRRAEAIWRVPFGDIQARWPVASRFYNERATPDCEAGRRGVLTLEEMFQERPLLSPEDRAHVSWMSGNESPTTQVYRASMWNLRKKRLFLTKLGYIGLGPAFARPGDKVVVFLGAAIPFVVRAIDGKFRLLGEAYCDGIMDGEILDVRAEETIVLI